MIKNTLNMASKPIVLLLALIAAALTSSLEASMIYAALPTIIRETGNLRGAGWLVTAFLLMFAGSAAIGGRIGDLYGRRRMLLAILALCLMGSALSAFCADFTWVIVGRAIQGLSGAILPLCYGLCSEHLARDKVPMGVSAVSGVYGLAGIFGFLTGAALSQYGHWQQIFLASSGIALVSIIVVAMVVPPSVSTARDQSLDIVGGALFVPALFLILIGATEAPKWRLGWQIVLATIGAGIVLMLYWVRYEWRHPHPLISVRLMRIPEIRIANALNAFAGLGSFQLIMIVFMLLQQQPDTGVGFGISALIAASLKIPGSIATGAGAPFAGWIASRSSPRAALLVSGAVQTCAWTVLCSSTTYLPGVIVGLTLGSLASGMLLSAVPVLILQVVPPARSSESTGTAGATLAVAMAVGSQLVLLLLAMSPAVARAGAKSMPSVFSYRLATLFVTCTVVAGLVTALWLPRKSEPLASATARGTAHL